VHTLQRVWTQLCMRMSKYLFNIHICKCTLAQNNCCSARHTHRKKCTCTRACAPMQRRLCNGAATPLPWKLSQNILSLGQASCRLLFAARPSAVSTHLSPDAARSRKQSKPTLSHNAVAAVLSDKHHPIIHVGAGPIQLVYALHSRLAADLILDKILFLPLIWRVLARLAKIPHPCPPMVINKLRIHKHMACANPAASVFANMYGDVGNTCVTYTPANALVLRTPV